MTASKSFGWILIAIGVLGAELLVFLGTSPIGPWQVAGIASGVMAAGWGMVLIVPERWKKPATVFMTIATAWGFFVVFSAVRAIG